MYKIVGDSSTEVDKSFLKKYPVELVPFKLYLDEKEFIDDEHLDVDQFVEEMKRAAKTPKTACPSPNDFLERFEGEEDEIYIVTISSKLSGTYNSAILAKNIYDGDNPGKKTIHVFDSLGAAAGQTLTVRRIHECKRQGLSSEDVVKTVTAYIDETTVLFISESLDNLIKNGRISKWKGLIATTLNILPIMGADKNGEIKLYEKVRNTNKAYQRLIELMQEGLTKSGRDVVAITHVGNVDRANQIEAGVRTVESVKDVVNIKCAGLSSLYADKKGIIVAF